MRFAQLVAATFVFALVLLTLGASSGGGKNFKCMVINDRLNKTYFGNVQPAVDEAGSGDTLWVRGYCAGPLEITKSLTLTGQLINGIDSTPVIMGTGAREKSVVHVSGSTVTVQINSLTLTGSNGRFPPHYGGGIWNERGHVILNNVTITQNFADYGAGIYNDRGAVELANSTIDTNFSRGGWGGGIYSAAGTLTLTGSEVTNNSASYGGGIAINVDWECPSYPCIPNPGAGSLSVSDSLIADNLARVRGGGIYTRYSVNVTLAGTTELARNQSDQSGGGAIIFSSSTLSLEDSATIHDNTASTGYGGGGIFTNSASVLNNCIAGTEGDEGVNVYNNSPDDIKTI